MKINLDNIKNKEVLVVGLGKSGIAALEAMVKLGAAVSVQDSKTAEDVAPELMAYIKENNVTGYFGGTPEKMDSFDMVVLSPGVPPELPFVVEAKNAGAEVIGELEVAYRFGKGKYVALTGTNGKTTTTTLVGEIFEKSGRETHVVGNIGVAVVSKSLDVDDDAWLVTETSSFQLETICDFRPEVSAVLNLTPDHLNRHKTMENYGAAKARIFENQDESQYLVINYDDKVCYELAKDCKAKIVPFSRLEELDFGAFVQEGYIVIKNEQGETVRFCMTEELAIPGAHNLENALAAVAIAYFAGIDAEVITKSLVEFQGVEHRIEFCGEVGGVRFVNDSKGTNPEASIKAIDAMKGGVILIAGGYDKGSTFDELIEAFNGKVKHMVLLGKTAQAIKETAEKYGFTNSVIVNDMEECVNEAYRLAEKGDNVLLSPACASWDMYKSFEHRGEHFKECVKKLGN